MHLFGLVALGYMWAQMAKTAQEKIVQGADGKAAFFDTKLATANFFMGRVMPETSMRLARIQAGSEAVMALPAEAF
jgi:hypothetical protein